MGGGQGKVKEMSANAQESGHTAWGVYAFLFLTFPGPAPPFGRTDLRDQGNVSEKE